MRVTFLVPGWARKPGGGYRVIYRYAGLLAAAGHDVSVVHGAFLEPWQATKRLRWRREARNVVRSVVDVARRRPTAVPWEDVDPRVSLRYAPTLAARHVPEGDVVVATAWRTAESAVRYPDGKGRRFYLVQHYETWDGPETRVDATWRAPLHKIVIARWLAERAEQLGAGPVTVIPNAIDTDVFRPTASLERPPRVVMLHSSAPIKGADVGVAALERAKQAAPELEAVLFGVRPRPRSLPAWIEYVENPPVEVLVRDVYNRGSIYLCPSFGEGWHLPPAEAAACGCAIVTTDIDGVADYAEDGCTALVAPVGDVEGLAARVVELVHDDDRRREMAEAALARIRRFSWAESGRRFEETIARIGAAT